MADHPSPLSRVGGKRAPPAPHLVGIAVANNLESGIIIYYE